MAQTRTQQIPRIGRIVIYNHPGSKDGKYLPAQSPAIIQRVNDNGTCFLWIFGAYGVQFSPATHCGDGPCEWNWPTRDEVCEHGTLAGVQAPVDEGGL